MGPRRTICARVGPADAKNRGAGPLSKGLRTCACCPATIDGGTRYDRDAMDLRTPPTPLSIVAPAGPLRGWIAGYWFVRDLEGAYHGRPVRTGPVPFAVLSIDLGRPNADECGRPVPTTSLLGLQSRARCWWPSECTDFVMVMLTPVGLARLLPHSGASAAALLDLGAVIGDAAAAGLRGAMLAVDGEAERAATLDAWFLALARRVAAPAELAAITRAHACLRAGARVTDAAAAADTHVRQLDRWLRRHLGVGPKALMDLERLHASVVAVQRGRGESLDGYSDQAHQIRSWRRRLATTPGAYRRAGRSVLVQGTLGADAPVAFYL